MFTLWILSFTIFAINFHQGYSVTVKKSFSTDRSDFLKQLSRPLKFVDKTLLINEFFVEPGNYRSISCPRKFGKSSLLNMLKFFVQIEVDHDGKKREKQQTKSYKVFTNESLGLKITSFKKLIERHLAEYPVIHLSFKGIVKTTLQESLQALHNKVKTAFASYHWLYDLLRKGDGSQGCRFEVLDRVKNASLFASNLTNCLYELSELLYCYFGKQVVVFIDDHDAALDEAFTSEFDYDIKQIHELIISMTSELLQPKSEHFVAYAFITSTIETVTNRKDYPRTVQHFRFLQSDTLSTYCGFTNDEVTSLISRNKPQDVSQQNTLKKYYNGYGTDVFSPGMYNPFAIKKYLSMSESEDISSIRQKKKMHFLPIFLQNALFYKTILHLTFSQSSSVYSNVQWFNVEKVISLIENCRRLEPPKDNNVDVLFWYLLENGYFTYCETPMGHFRVPNEGIRSEIVNYVFKFYDSDRELANGTVEIASIVKEILQGEIQTNLFERLKKFLDSFVPKMAHYLHQFTNKEYHYQAVLYYWIKKSFINTGVDVSISPHDNDKSSNVITVANNSVFLMIQLKCKCRFSQILEQVQMHNSSFGDRYPESIHYLAINYKRNFTQIAYCNLTINSSIFIDDHCSKPKTTLPLIYDYDVTKKPWFTTSTRKFRRKVSRLPWVNHNLY